MRYKARTNLNIKKIDIVITITIFIIVLTFILLKIFTVKSEKYLDTYAKNQTKNIAETIITEAIYEEFYENPIDSETIIKTSKNSENEIIDIDFNTTQLNIYLYKITNKITDNLISLESGNIKNTSNFYEVSKNIYYIPIGIILDVPIITNITPKIPFKIKTIGNVESNIETKITEYGINNSLLEIYLNIIINIQILYPFISTSVVIEKNMPISTKIIQGKIPSYYGGLISTTFAYSK